MAKTKEIQDAAEGMEVYEVGYLALPSIAEDKLGDVVEKIKNIVSKAGGVEIDGEAPFKQDLAYSMTKVIGASRYVVSDAYVGWIKFELEPSKTLEVKAALDAMDELVRFLLIKVPRETVFTFAEAKKALEEEEKEAMKEESENAEEAPRASDAVVE